MYGIRTYWYRILSSNCSIFLLGRGRPIKSMLFRGLSHIKMIVCGGCSASCCKWTWDVSKVRKPWLRPVWPLCLQLRVVWHPQRTVCTAGNWPELFMIHFLRPRGSKCIRVYTRLEESILWCSSRRFDREPRHTVILRIILFTDAFGICLCTPLLPNNNMKNKRKLLILNPRGNGRESKTAWLHNLANNWDPPWQVDCATLTSSLESKKH